MILISLIYFCLGMLAYGFVIPIIEQIVALISQKIQVYIGKDALTVRKMQAEASEEEPQRLIGFQIPDGEPEYDDDEEYEDDDE